MSKEYQEAYRQYTSACAKAKGDGPDAKIAFADKAKIMSDIRRMERESARGGSVLTPLVKGDRVDMKSDKTDTLKSLQEEYVRKFDDKKPVELRGKKTTLRQYHRERLKV